MVDLADLAKPHPPPEFSMSDDHRTKPAVGPQEGDLSIKLVAWTARTFTFDLPLGAFPAVLERLRGTPARATELISGAAENLLSMRLNGKWSVKEHLGHLADLGTLEELRLREFLSGAAILSAADMANRVTEAAGHNQVPMAHLLKRLRSRRFDWVRKLEALTEEEISRTALHPRLQQPMRILDFAYFVAEHDDHHLAQARHTILGLGRPTTTRRTQS
jgi:hypothetical protein